MKQLIAFELDGQPVYVEAEISEAEKMRRASRGGGKGEPEKAVSRFTEAVARIKPAAEVVLNAFREMNTPDEIGLEFGLNFSAKAGAVFTPCIMRLVWISIVHPDGRRAGCRFAP